MSRSLWCSEFRVARYAAVLRVRVSFFAVFAKRRRMMAFSFVRLPSRRKTITKWVIDNLNKNDIKSNRRWQSIGFAGTNARAAAAAAAKVQRHVAQKAPLCGQTRDPCFALFSSVLRALTWHGKSNSSSSFDCLAIGSLLASPNHHHRLYTTFHHHPLLSSPPRRICVTFRKILQLLDFMAICLWPRTWRRNAATRQDNPVKYHPFTILFIAIHRCFDMNLVDA